MTPKNHKSFVDWKVFLTICRQVLGQGSWEPHLSKSWCAYTTFSSLEHNAIYWSCGFPESSELLDEKTVDGGLWRQSIYYTDIAHLIVPKKFYWESCLDGNFESGYKTQDLDLLSSKLKAENIDHEKNEILLEIKLY